MPLELHRMRNTITSSNSLPKSRALELQLEPCLFSVPTLLAQVWVLLSCVIHSAYWPDEFLFWLIQHNQILTPWYQKPISRRGLVWGFIYLFFGFVLFWGFGGVVVWFVGLFLVFGQDLSWIWSLVTAHVISWWRFFLIGLLQYSYSLLIINQCVW